MTGNYLNDGTNQLLLTQKTIFSNLFDIYIEIHWRQDELIHKKRGLLLTLINFEQESKEALTR